MPWKRIALSFALLVFLFLTFRTIHALSYMGAITAFSSNPVSELFSADLVISLTLISIWMIVDARKHGNSWTPFLGITILFGIAGPLLYLIVRDFSIKVQRIEAFILLIALSVYSLINFSSPEKIQGISQLNTSQPFSTQLSNHQEVSFDQHKLILAEVFKDSPS